MKAKFHKILNIDSTLDSSEAVMFTKGGKHTVNLKQLKQTNYDDDEENDDNLPRHIRFQDFDEINLSVQIEKCSMSTFNHTYGEAQKHRAQWDEINKAEGKTPPPNIPPAGKL